MSRVFLIVLLSGLIGVLELIQAMAVALTPVVFSGYLVLRYTPAVLRVLAEHVHVVVYLLLSILYLFGLQFLMAMAYAVLAARHTKQVASASHERVIDPMVRLWKLVQPCCWVAQRCEETLAALRRWRALLW